MSNYFDLIGKDVLIYMLEFCTPEDTINISITNKSLRKTVLSEDYG